jgi:dihydrofolate synthase / folylpolyglutamate synthase
VPHDALEYLSSLERLGMKFGLDNITRLCAGLDNPQNAFHSVIVAGTNGKGSVTAMVERALRAAGHRTGRYTSPHLTQLEERFVIDGHAVDTRSLRRMAERVQHVVRVLLQRGEMNGEPTFFEFTTGVAFALFHEARVEIAVLEVGLGGRLDATNIVTPIAAAITSIDLDHQEQLGDTIASIAREKAGVIKPGIPVVCGPMPVDAERVIREACDAAGARAIAAPADLPAEFRGLELSLRGAHQRINASIAVVLLRQLDGLGWRIGDEAIRAGLTDVDWPGRLEEFGFRDARVLIDAAHNPAGARALCAFLRDNGWTDCAIVFGAMRDKDAAAMLGELAPVCGALVCTTAPAPRAAAAGELAAIAASAVPGIPVEPVGDPAAALARACALRPRVAVAGSIFLIGPLRVILRAS